MKPAFVKKLPVKVQGNNVIEIRFSDKVGFTRKEVEEIADEIRDTYKAKLNGKVLVNLQFDEGWRHGSMTDLGQPISIYDASMYDYDVPDNFKDQDRWNQFSIMLIPVSRKGGCDGRLNDCLWFCLRKAYGGEEYMPPKINTCPRRSTPPAS